MTHRACGCHSEAKRGIRRLAACFVEPRLPNLDSAPHAGTTLVASGSIRDRRNPENACDLPQPTSGTESNAWQSFSDGAQNRFQDFPYVGGHDLMPFGGRMNTVRQVELAHAADAFQNKGNERSFVFLGEIDENRLEFLCVVLAHVGRDFHSCDDDFRLGIFCPCPIDDRLEVFLRTFNRQPAQAVIAAELQYQNIDAIFKEPIEPVQCSRTGIAALPRVNRFKAPSLGVDLLLNQRRECL